ASMEGLRHCLLRLEQLDKVQRDHGELTAMQAALAAEIEGLGALQEAAALAQRGDAPATLARLREFPALRPRLLLPDRLDARSLELVDDLFERAERSLAAGRAGVADQWLEALACLVESHPDLVERMTGLRRRCAAQKQNAEDAAGRGQ